MKRFLTGLMVVALTAGMAAPAHAGRDDIGLLAGALGGGVIGHQFGQGKGNTWATAIGAVAGAFAGQSVGRSLDRAEHAYSYRGGRSHYTPRYQTTYYRPAPVYYVPSYEARVRTYEVRPTRNINYVMVDNSVSAASNSRYCREYNSAVTVGGRTQPSYGTACLQPDGSWEIVD